MLAQLNKVFVTVRCFLKHPYHVFTIFVDGETTIIASTIPTSCYFIVWIKFQARKIIQTYIILSQVMGVQTCWTMIASHHFIVIMMVILVTIWIIIVYTNYFLHFFWYISIFIKVLSSTSLNNFRKNTKHIKVLENYIWWWGTHILNYSSPHLC